MRSSHRIIASVAVSAACAGVFVQLAFSPVPVQTAQNNVAGIEMMQVLRDEHALAADYVTQNLQAQREANLAADQDAASMRLAAAEPAETPGMRLVADAKHIAPRRLILRTPEAIQPPLQLAALMEPAAPKPAAAPAGNIVTKHVRTVVATVERIPNWVREAAIWVVELPSQALPRVSQRRYFSAVTAPYPAAKRIVVSKL